MSFSLLRILLNHFSLFFFFNDTATTEIYTLSLHDALPICYVKNALSGLVFEGLLGALLTGLMVFLFLRDIRSALIVVINIPLALLTSVVCLYLTGQTINIMTLGGLALSIGILVDEATVTIENIHHHLELGKSKARAIWDACREIAVPKLLILLSILAVFVPALFISGVPRSMFIPLSLAGRFSD